MARQIEVPGTERKDVSKKLRKLGEKHAEAINATTRARVEKRDTELALLAQMEEEGVEHYRDTEVTPPIDIKLSTKKKITVKKYRAPEGEEEDHVEELKKKAKKKNAEEDFN